MTLWVTLSVASDDRAQAAAVKARLSSHMVAPWKAYDFDELPSPAPRIHVLVTVAQRFGGNARLSGSILGTGWRMTATAVGGTVDECRRAVEAVSKIRNERLTVGGEQSSPVAFEAATAPVLDDGAYSATSSWTYAF